MSKRVKLSDLLNTTIGMVTLRNNSTQDDGTDSVSGVDWFTFNGVVASTIYVNGNSWVGFGSSSEHLKVCRTDGKMLYLYRQEGTVGSKRFLKLRWEGYSYWNSTASIYALKWELFLFDDGGMYLNIIDVPDSSGDLGTSSLTYGAKTLTIPVTLSKPVSYSLLLRNGTFALSDGVYPGTEHEYVYSGVYECHVTSIQQVTDVSRGVISWDEILPAGTSISVYTKLSRGEYTKCSNYGEIAGLIPGTDLSSETLNIKIEMSTSDPYSTPELSNLEIRMYRVSDANVIILHFEDGMNTSIRNAVGPVTVQYIGTTLMGEGGPVLGFQKSFVPDGLYMKPNPYHAEHVEIYSVSKTAQLTAIRYLSVSDSGEHVTVSSASKSGILTHIDHI